MVIEMSEASGRVVKALNVAHARQDAGDGFKGEGTVHALIRCLIRMCRIQTHREQQRGDVKVVREGQLEGDGAVFFSGLLTTMLSINRSLLYPVLAHEATSFFRRGQSEPKEVLSVVGPLASSILLEPECEFCFVPKARLRIVTRLMNCDKIEQGNGSCVRGKRSSRPPSISNVH